MEERIAAGLAAMGVPLPSPAAPAMLARYGQLLLEKNQVMNLTAITDPDKVADLHFWTPPPCSPWRVWISRASGSSTWAPARDFPVCP